MPAISRMLRFGALSAASLGVVASGLVATPAEAARDREAVAMSPAETKAYDARVKERRERAAKRLSARLRTATNIAMNQRGDAYGYGGAGPNVFDCSGLIFYSYRRAGFNVPRSSSAQAGYTRRVAKKNMRPGDLMFFSNGGGVYHAAIFVRWDRGGAVMLHSPEPGRSVTVTRPWTSNWFGGTLR